MHGIKPGIHACWQCIMVLFNGRLSRNVISIINYKLRMAGIYTARIPIECIHVLYTLTIEMDVLLVRHNYIKFDWFRIH